MLTNFSKKDFKLDVSKTLSKFKINDSELSLFDKVILNFLLANDDGSGWIFFIWDQELIDQLKIPILDDAELLLKFKESLRKLSLIEITAKQKDDELFSRIIASYHIRTVNSRVHIIVNLSKEFIITIPPTLFSTESSKKTYKKDT